MRWRLLALISVGLNVVLAALWLTAIRRPAAPLSPAVAVPSNAPPAAVKTNLVVRRQFFSWQEVESPDFPTYIANLRDIGCPEQTIHDIIIADVNGLFAKRRATELVTAEQQWWRSEPDTNVVQAALERLRGLEDERRGLLSRLLGTNWESSDLVNLPRPSRPAVTLDGPVLGELPTETKQAIQEISLRSQERMQTYLDGLKRDGKNADPAELARLRQQTREELARVLAPPQLEEFLLRYSQNASDLRAEFGQLRFFNPTPDEFRAVFRVTDALDQQIQLLTGNDPATVQQRNLLETERANAIKAALGTKRYQEYVLLQDPLYRDAVASAVQAGTPEAARALYAINLAAAGEEDRINSDTNLTASQRSLELKRLELEQLRANTVATGQELPPEPPSAPPQPAGPPRRSYVVRPGDSIAVISMVYGVPARAIRQANPNVNFNRLRPGDVVNIPPVVQAAPAPAP